MSSSNLIKVDFKARCVVDTPNSGNSNNIIQEGNLLVINNAHLEGSTNAAPTSKNLTLSNQKENKEKEVTYEVLEADMLSKQTTDSTSYLLEAQGTSNFSPSQNDNFEKVLPPNELQEYRCASEVSLGVEGLQDQKGCESLEADGYFYNPTNKRNEANHSSFGSTSVLSRAVIERNQSAAGMILPAAEEVYNQTIQEHDSEPIKKVEDIERLSQWYISQGKYRDNMLLIVGINLGLRVSDLLRLTFAHLINEDFTFKRTFPILEKKTAKTRKVAKNRYLTINDAIIEAVLLYLDHTPNVRLNDYLFKSESNNGSNINKPMHSNNVAIALQKGAKAIGLDIRVATHTLRKTFGYHQMMMGGSDSRRLLLLQKIFGHSSSTQTLTYIGITKEEIEAAYLGLNLGSSKHYLIDSAFAMQQS